MFHHFRQTMVRLKRARLHGLVEVEEIDPAITDQRLRASRKGRKSHTAKVLVVQAVEIPEPSGF